MTIDCITYNNESELFEIRYNILEDYVDEFRVIEFDKTFSGKMKAGTFTQNWPKVKYYFVTEDIWSKYEELAKSSPNTEYGKGAEHWLREFQQKESIKNCLTDLNGYDILFIGDCDELWRPQAIDLNFGKLKLDVYSYWLNNRSNEEFWGTLVCEYRQVKDTCLNHMRINSPKTKYSFGWHFTSMGGVENVKKKLTDSYTQDSYANDEVLENLEHNIVSNKDFLGRNFEYKIDESEWPRWLKDNKLKYAHLLK